MKLKQLGSNQTQVSIGTNEVLFSYETPVAYQDISGMYYKTSKKWSVTTSRHINKWLGGCNANEVSQETLDNLCSEVK